MMHRDNIILLKITYWMMIPFGAGCIIYGLLADNHKAIFAGLLSLAMGAAFWWLKRIEIRQGKQ